MTLVQGHRDAALTAAPILAAMALALSGCGGGSSSAKSTAAKSPAETVTSTVAAVSSASTPPSHVSRHHRSRRHAAALIAAGAGAAAGAVSGAGAAAGSGSGAGAAHVPGRPKAGKAPQTGRHRAATGATGPRVRTSSPIQTGPPPLDPCTLVSGAEAQSIVGAALLAHKEAPLGPTCVFEFKGPTSTITMAIERLSFPKTVREMKQAKQSQVAGHQAECGMLGAQMLFISLSGGRVLNVTAPCSIARAIGARALLHLPV